jgi:hypothetical protein
MRSGKRTYRSQLSLLMQSAAIEVSDRRVVMNAMGAGAESAVKEDHGAVRNVEVEVEDTIHSMMRMGSRERDGEDCK